MISIVKSIVQSLSVTLLPSLPQHSYESTGMYLLTPVDVTVDSNNSISSNNVKNNKGLACNHLWVIAAAY